MITLVGVSLVTKEDIVKQISMSVNQIPVIMEQTVPIFLTHTSATVKMVLEFLIRPHLNTLQYLGFEGRNCEVDINECESNPCKNNGTCVDEINDYNCTCKDGFVGKSCEVNSNVFVSLF